MGSSTGSASPDPAAHALGAVDVAAWCTRFELISNPTRLQLLLCLHFSPGITVTRLAAASGVSQTVVSQSLRRLRDREWVEAAKVGREHRYRIVDESLHRLLHVIGAPHSEKSAQHSNGSGPA
ncbi:MULTISPECIES: ArsR/SmtB family transcription factor [Arthrobacter]|uniref:ArsR family transcriptional regulator n=1 Tax=Arthrobacter caoxuetaonis TaxID=2886935 RepID=A0A9X1SAW7_9MICC|nr:MULTISPECIES: helix-turn-helix transcriptional regulator [Arthrobacter]MCC3283845.1 ArsR family transcriptional regulator [Arthrobacter caoxuetaonis]MCC3297160.1 ArsR family transcriptional regulator [Arthrobacter caoxuetaonis]MCC9194049.1 ArsR family transcriptional regulator [Arthrobacter sp. zg-Y916]USQ58280.1 ArsR family transcriptional regulator [Arthrobacter caoxuetaonis]